MIVGINMHQPSSADLRHPTNLVRDNATLSEGRLSSSGNEQITDHDASEYAMHLQLQHYHYGVAPASQQSMPSTLATNGSVVPTTTPGNPHSVFGTDETLGQQHVGMIGLEQQFAQLGMQQQERTDHPSVYNDSDGHVESDQNNEGEENEDEPVKLFVGQVPKTLNEEDIFPTFDSFGPLKDVAVIRDKHTGLHRGCAFVTYWSASDAESAREALHDKFTFPGGKRPAQVKPAEPSGMSNVPNMGYFGNYEYANSHESHPIPTAPSNDENKLFVGMLPPSCNEIDVQHIFSQFGEIHEVYMIRNADGSSKCAAFLRFDRRESAIRAIEHLNGVEIMDGAQRPLIVKFADNQKIKQQKHVRNIRRHEMMSMIGPGGYPYHPQVAPMMMGMHPNAGPPYPLPHNAQPQVFGPPHSHYMYPPSYGQVPQYAYHHPAPRPDLNRPPMASSNNAVRPREGPAGANLFVYHLPHDLTDADLATAFNPFGNVISAKVYVDKYTGESKGFGFVSYDSVVAADQAIEQMNGFQIGNKRLKVQHKRVHGSHGSVGGSSSVLLESNSQTSSGNNSTTAEHE